MVYIEALVFLITSVTVLFWALYFYLLFTTVDKYPIIIEYKQEEYYLDPNAGMSKCWFPSLLEYATLDLSVIIPAYNEEQRLPSMLDECVEFLENRTKTNPDYKYEIIVVDDGSRDKTTEVALKYAEKLGVSKFRVLTLIKNRGKGGAVRYGTFRARGEYILFADADGATKFGDLEKLEKVMKERATTCDKLVVVGSRAHLEKEAMATRSVFRTVLMKGFHTLVWLLCVRGVRDTQCGFKLFNRKTAQTLFIALHVERWAFDVELLYISQALSIKIYEVAVNWTEIEGSKLVPFWSWLEMGRDLVLIWFRYQTKLWAINSIIL